jgi:hypothetical protein
MSTKAVSSGAVALLCLSSLANAGTVVIDALGGPVQMHSTTVNNVFGSASPVLTNSALTSIHDSLNADGVGTAGKVTFVLLDTDAGLSFVTLVDNNPNGEGSGTADSSLSMTSTANTLNQEFINDQGSDITTLVDPGFGLQTAAGEFNWDSDIEGDGFAWANLAVGDTATFNFDKLFGDLPTSPGLSDSDTFQFVSFNGESWEIVSVGNWTDNNQFAFSYTVVPLPAALGVGLAGLAMVTLRRKRFR